MSVLQKKKKIDINLQSIGSFLNINKAKFISIGKSLKINNINIKKNEHNISQDTFHNANATRQTESSSKDEVIKALKDRLTVLEKKVELLEIKNTSNILRKNFLNLSHGNYKMRNKDLKLNIRIFKNKRNKTNTLDLSKSEMDKTGNNEKSHLYQNHNIINNTSNIKNKKFSKNLNFFDSINTSGNHINANKIKNKIRISNSASKYENFTIIPKHSTKKKIFVDLFKRKLIRFETVENEKVENIKDNNCIINRNIPKVPKNGKNITKSEKIKKHMSKLNEIKTQNFNESKKNFLLLTRFSRKNTCDINIKHHMKLESNFHNKNNSFHDFKKKLDNIKNRTKNLLQFYTDIKINNFNFNVNCNDK